MLCALYAGTLGAANPIQIENAKPGTGDWRMFSESVSGEIEGYASATSVNLGESIRIYVNTTDPTYTMNVFRLGWYNGDGGRLMRGPIQRDGIRQVIPQPHPVTGLIECDWVDSYTLTIPTDWVSGVYVVKLSADVAKKDKYVMFVVRDDARGSNHNFQLTVTTGQAYNAWGGKSLYPNSSQGLAADKVSFNRPYHDGSGTGIFLWRWEYNALRFLEREGFDVTYTTNIDTHRNAQQLLAHADMLSIGHDEYWSHEMRANVEAAIAAGVHMGFFSGNNAYWQIRFEPSSVNGEPLRTMVSYKEDALTKDPYAIDTDRRNDHLVTTRFRDAPVNRPESAFLGVEYVYNPIDSDVVIDNVTSAPWVFEGTGLTRGSVLPGLLGYEVDAMTFNSPAGIVRLAASPFYNESTKRTEYSHMTVYVAPSGATVFSAGTIQWAWGLDEWRSSLRTSRVNAHAQQITRNVLRRFAGANEAADCQFNFSSQSLSLPVEAGTGSISIATNSWCSWTATSSESWLRVTSATSATGAATLTYAFDANPGSVRTATIDVGGNKLTVQQATGCTVVLEPRAASMPANGGTGIVKVVMSSPACAWSATTKATWITIETAGGAGSADLRYRVMKNNTAASRDAQILVNGIRFNVHQPKGTGEPAAKRRRSVR